MKLSMMTRRLCKQRPRVSLCHFIRSIPCLFYMPHLTCLIFALGSLQDRRTARLSYQRLASESNHLRLVSLWMPPSFSCQLFLLPLSFVSSSLRLFSLWLWHIVSEPLKDAWDLTVFEHRGRLKLNARKGGMLMRPVCSHKGLWDLLLTFYMLCPAEVFPWVFNVNHLVFPSSCCVLIDIIFVFMTDIVSVFVNLFSSFSALAFPCRHVVGQELIGRSRTTMHAAAKVLFNPSKTNLVDEPKIKLFILVLKHVAHTEWSFKLKYAFHFNELVGFVLSCSQQSVLLFCYTTFCLTQIMMQIVAFHWHSTTYYTAFEISA